MAKLNHFIANKVGIEMDQIAVLIACASVVASYVFIYKYLVPLVKPIEEQVQEDEVQEDEVQEEAQEEEQVVQEDEEEEEQEDVSPHEGEVESGEIADNEMPSDMPDLEDECEWITKEDVESDINKYRNEMTTAIDNKIDHLRNELNSTMDIDIMDASIQLEEKIMKNIKEWFVPLHAKKELDTTHYQGWQGTAELDTTTLEITVKNTTYSTYEENDVWVDLTSNSEDSVKYRDSLLGLHDYSSWSYNTNDQKTNASLTKRYVTLGWNHSVSITVTISNMPLTPMISDEGIKKAAMDTLKKFQITWKRVLYTNKA